MAQELLDAGQPTTDLIRKTLANPRDPHLEPAAVLLQIQALAARCTEEGVADKSVLGIWLASCLVLETKLQARLLDDTYDSALAEILLKIPEIHGRSI